MHGRNWTRAAALAAVLAGSASFADGAAGKAIYDRDCASCHGATGKGDGDDAAYFTTKPTDFTDRAKLSRRSGQGNLEGHAGDEEPLGSRREVAGGLRAPALRAREGRQVTDGGDPQRK